MKFNLKQYRTVKGWTQTDVAKLLGVSIKTVSNWELGTYAMPRDVEERLGEKLNPATMTEDELDRLDPLVCYATCGKAHPEWYLRVRGGGWTRTRLHPAYGWAYLPRVSQLPALIEAQKLKASQPLTRIEELKRNIENASTPQEADELSIELMEEYKKK